MKQYDNENNSIFTGLWKKISKKGKPYYASKAPIEINGKRYWISLFKNLKEESTQDLNLFLNEAEDRPQNKQEPERDQDPDPNFDNNDDIPF